MEWHRFKVKEENAGDCNSFNDWNTSVCSNLAKYRFESRTFFFSYLLLNVTFFFFSFCVCVVVVVVLFIKVNQCLGPHKISRMFWKSNYTRKQHTNTKKHTPPPTTPPPHTHTHTHTHTEEPQHAQNRPTKWHWKYNEERTVKLVRHALKIFTDIAQVTNKWCQQILCESKVYCINYTHPTQLGDPRVLGQSWYNEGTETALIYSTEAIR